MLPKQLKGLTRKQAVGLLIQMYKFLSYLCATVMSVWSVGLAKIPRYCWCEIKLSCCFHSLTGCNKTSLILGRGKRWISFPAITGYFVNENSLPEKPPTDYLAPLSDSSQYCMVDQARTYMNIDMAR